MEAYFERFTIELTEEQARQGSHQGRCDEDVQALLELPEIKAQLDKIPANSIREELKEYGAWDDEELLDDDENRLRILWIACGNVLEDLNNPTPVKFRKFPEGDVIAFLYGYPCNSGMIMSYQHVGQHGEASIELVDELEPCTEDEYTPLLEELKSIGYVLEVL